MMKTALFTKQDLDQINGTIKPKRWKAIFAISLGALAFCFLLPFFPGKHTPLSPYREGTYWHAFAFYLIFFSASMLLIYYRFIAGINQDLRDGEKIVARLPVKVKNTLIFGGKFELIFDKERLLHTPKITLPKEELDGWQEGDLVEINLLYKSGEILNYKKVNSKEL